jgi:hypothetical protein
VGVTRVDAIAYAVALNPLRPHVPFSPLPALLEIHTPSTLSSHPSMGDDRLGS